MTLHRRRRHRSVTGGTDATIRYRNLVGQRYIALTQERRRHRAGCPRTRRSRSDRTKPALDLTVLFNGFKPLFQALSPDDINKLSYEIVQVFQGEGGTLEGLLAAHRLGDHDAGRPRRGDRRPDRQPQRGAGHIGDRDEQLSRLIDSFQHARRRAQGRPGGHPRLAATTISDLADADRRPRRRHPPPFVQDIKQLRDVAGNLDKNKAELDRALQVLPIKLEKIGRTAIYGSWFNFYLCEFQGRVDAARQRSTSRCRLPAGAPTRCGASSE